MSLEFAPKSKHIQVIKNDVIRGVQRHAMDYSSMEAASKWIKYFHTEVFLKINS